VLGSTDVAEGDSERPAPELLGRADALERVARALDDGGAVWVTGPAEVGKSALAAAATAGRARWIDADDLARVRRAARAPDDGRVLVIDGADDLEPAMVERLAGDARRVLVTARATPVAPLGHVLRLDPLSAADAAALFSRRARRIRPELDCPASIVAQLVERLDHLPGAIVRAARRLVLLEPVQILDHLDAPFELRPELAQSLGRSWARLDPSGQLTLRRASVFEGAFTEDAARTVLGLAEPLRHLEALVRASLARPAPGGRIVIPGLVRAFVRRHVSDDARAAIWARHEAWAIERAQRAARLEEGFEAPADLDALEALAPELRAAIGRGLPATLRARATLARDALWIARGSPPIHAEMLEGALAAGAPVPWHARLLVARGRLRWIRNEAPLEDFERARVLVAGTASVAENEAHRMLALAHAELGDATAALTHARAALEGWGQRGSVAARAVCESVLMQVQDRAGCPEASLRHGRRALALHRQAHHRRGELITTVTLGIALLDQEAVGEARERLTRGRELALELGDRRFEGLARLGLAVLDPDDEGFAEARRCFEAIGDDRNAAMTNGYEGLVALAAGDRTEAALKLSEAVAFFEALGFSGRAPCFLAALVVAGSAPRQDLRRAYELCGSDALGAHAVRAYAAIAEGRAPDARVPRPHPIELRLAHAAAARAARADLRVATDGSWFETPERGRVSLARRDAPRRILAGLYERARGDDDSPFDVEALQAIGWPGERILPEAGATRVYAAVATLRRLGLRGYLKTFGSGYRLDLERADARGARARSGVRRRSDRPRTVDRSESEGR